MSTNMDIDKSLDEIMKDKPKARRGGRRGGAPTTGARARYATTVPKAAPKTAAAPKPVTVEAIKIIISNLPQDVTEAAVRVSLTDMQNSLTFPGPHAIYGRTCENGTNVVQRDRKEYRSGYCRVQEQGRRQQGPCCLMIDNQRPMKVEIAIDLNQAQSLASRVAPAAPARSGTQPRGGRGGRGGRGAAKPRAPRPVKKTAEELDAEMAAYKTDAA
ncbi:hypothetical protein IAR55_003476 [Kwoniella newhampshirensis]|uniref:Chromatin target of PRMT1 protein C-terminal domain-containing protein n=1 Tax=Kwoniella newhampshirensis TaxID=1651941 RepID=A0AAW0YYQ4_9TREE